MLAVEPGQGLGDAGNDVLALALPDRARSVVRGLQARGIDRVPHRLRCRPARSRATAACRPGGAAAWRSARANPSAPAGRPPVPATGRARPRGGARSRWRSRPAAPQSSASSSCDSGMPAANGASSSARLAKPWMVKMAASSKFWTAASRRLIMSASDSAWRGAQAVQQLVGEDIAGRAAPLQPRQHLHHALADALAQFGRGGDGEGDDQDLLHLEPVLQHQAQVEAADGPGLAGAGRGLDQVRAVQRAGEDVERDGGVGRHGRAPSLQHGLEDRHGQLVEIGVGQRIGQAAEGQLVGGVGHPRQRACSW